MRVDEDGASSRTHREAANALSASRESTEEKPIQSNVGRVATDAILVAPPLNPTGLDCTEASDSHPSDNDCVLHSVNRGLELLGTDHRPSKDDLTRAQAVLVAQNPDDGRRTQNPLAAVADPADGRHMALLSEKDSMSLGSQGAADTEGSPEPPLPTLADLLHLSHDPALNSSESAKTQLIKFHHPNQLLNAIYVTQQKVLPNHLSDLEFTDAIFYFAYVMHLVVWFTVLALGCHEHRWVLLGLELSTVPGFLFFLLPALFGRRAARALPHPVLTTRASTRAIAHVPRVAICICRYQEPLEDLANTLTSTLHVEYEYSAKTIYILDDGFWNRSDGQNLELCRLIDQVVNKCDSALLAVPDLTCNDARRDDCATESYFWQVGECVCLIARKKPTTSHFKAGNINNLIFNHFSTLPNKPDILLILDHDMMVMPNILWHAVPHFFVTTHGLLDDQLRFNDLAFIQYPQRFFDIDGADYFYHGNEFFFDGSMLNLGAIGCCPFAGTNCLWRMDALYSIGGLQYHTITEDMKTGRAAHLRGWSSAYLTANMAVGSAPQSVDDSMKQRFRWAKGSIEILLNKETNSPATDKEEEEADVLRNMPDRMTRDRWTVRVFYATAMTWPLWSVGAVYFVVTIISQLWSNHVFVHLGETWSPWGQILLVTMGALRLILLFTAFPHVTWEAIWRSMQGWLGYSLPLCKGILEAGVDRCVGKGSSQWFNTGAGNTKRYVLQYGNAVAFGVVLLAMIFHVVYYVISGNEDDGGTQSITLLAFGALVLFLLMDWCARLFKSSDARPHMLHDNGAYELKYSMDSPACASMVHSNNNFARRHFVLPACLGVCLGCLLLVMPRLSRYDQEDTAAPIEQDLVQSSHLYPPFSVDFKADLGWHADAGVLKVNGHEFVIKGVNWYGFEGVAEMVGGLMRTSQDSVCYTLALHGFNAVRLPVAVNSVLANAQAALWEVDLQLNPHMSGAATYIQGVERFMERSAQWGMLTLLDMHRLRANQPHNPLWYDEHTPVQDLMAAWGLLAESFCDKWYIIGADIFNEPFDATWGGDSHTDWKAAAESIGSHIHRICPRWLIFVAGVTLPGPLRGHAFNWNAFVSPAASNPITSYAGKVVYSPHVYGPGTVGYRPFWDFECDELCMMCFCSDGRPANLTCILQPVSPDYHRYVGVPETPNVTLQGLREELSPECATLLRPSVEFYPQNMEPAWEHQFGLNLTVVVGEWGGTYLGERTSGAGRLMNNSRKLEAIWQQSFQAYIAKRRLGSFYWCVNPDSGDTGGLLLDDWVTIDKAKFSLLRRIHGTQLSAIIVDQWAPIISKPHDPGALFRAVSDLSYDHESLVYNKALDQRNTPTSIVFPTNPEEVASAIGHASEHGHLICVRSGGHSYEGYSLCNGVLIDVRNIDDVSRVSNSLYWVGMGHTVGELNVKLARDHKFVPSGSHSGVGMGYFLGCGYGTLSRAYGMGCDSIVALRLVTPNQTILMVNETTHSGLFWALRGAGHAHFGVVTHIKFQVHDVPSSFYTFKLSYKRERAVEVALFWQAWAVEHPRLNLSVALWLWNEQRQYISLEGVLIGTWGDLRVVFDEVNQHLANPQEILHRQHDMTGLLAELYGIEDPLQIGVPNIGRSGERRFFKNKGHFMTQSLNASSWTSLITHAYSNVPGATAYNNWVSLSPMGGVIRHVQSNATAFGHRQAQALVQYGGYWENANSKVAMLNHQRLLYKSMDSHWGASAFANYADSDLNDPMPAYYGRQNVDRLHGLKCLWDPNGLFISNPQSIKCM